MGGGREGSFSLRDQKIMQLLFLHHSHTRDRDSEDIQYIFAVAKQTLSERNMNHPKASIISGLRLQSFRKLENKKSASHRNKKKVLRDIRPLKPSQCTNFLIHFVNDTFTSHILTMTL